MIQAEDIHEVEINGERIRYDLSSQGEIQEVKSFLEETHEYIGTSRVEFHNGHSRQYGREAHYFKIKNYE